VQAFARAAATAQAGAGGLASATAEAAARAGTTIPICVFAAPQIAQVGVLRLLS
jgi:pyruvate/2-oxoglutarate dehydrogenase complex dihydrolipoamide dehydrogenase (E3) component